MFTRARLSLYRSLHRPRVRRQEGLYFVEGRRLVDEALASGADVEDLLVTARFAESNPDLIESAAAAGVKAVPVSERDLGRISDVKTAPGVLAVIRRGETDPGALQRDGVLLALDGVSDPGNTGTLVRAADGFGATAVIAAGETADFENPKVLRAAMGSTFHLPLIRTPDLAAELATQAENGCRIVVATLDGKNLYDFEPPAGRLCLVLGSEAHGVSPAVLALAETRVTVPAPGRAESLNVAMAGAIVLSWLSHRTREEQ